MLREFLFIFVILSFGGNSGLPKCLGWIAQEAAVICSDHLGSSSQSSLDGGWKALTSLSHISVGFFGGMVMERGPDGDVLAPFSPCNATLLPTAAPWGEHSFVPGRAC